MLAPEFQVLLLIRISCLFYDFYLSIGLCIALFERTFFKTIW